MASSGSAVCTAPADYGELFLDYGEDIRRVVWRQLGSAASLADVDDGVQYILGQFIKNGVIGQYKPGTISNFNHNPVSFKAFILAKVALYCRGLRESAGRRAGREPLLVDADGWKDPGRADQYPALDDSADLQRLREVLASRVMSSGRPLLPLFDALAGRFADGRRVDPSAVSRRLGVTREEADAWFAELQSALREASSPRRYELGGLLLSGPQVRAAIDALRACTGNRVLPAFQRAGHPLQAAGKTWYLVFAAKVMTEYPETRTSKGGHYPGGHFGRVKAALIYGLERLLGDDAVPIAPPALPAPPKLRALPPVTVDPWQDLRDALARVPGMDDDARQAAFEVVQALAAA